MRTLNHVGESGERGVSLMIVTASLMFMFGLASLVVDGGTGWSERRQAQSAADFAVLAALQFSVSCDSSCSTVDAANSGAEEAKDVVEGNLPGRFTDADWSSCSDPDRPERFDDGHIAGVTPCVSFTVNFDEARVVLPEDTVDTSFAKVIGFDSLTVGAFAEAGQGTNISAVVLPLNPNGAGPETCLFTNQEPQGIEPCDGPDTGSFGYIDLALYGNEELGTPSTCASGNQNAKISVNMSKGSDHILTTYTGGDPVVGDHEACPNRSEDINEVIFEPGAPTGGITTGVVQPVSVNILGHTVTGPARLGCDSDNCETVRGRSLDHRPLWSYLNGGCPGTTDHATMAACLDGWTGGVIFSEDLAQNRRFAAVPILVPSPTGGPKDRLIDAFEAVWLESVYMNCTSGNCETIHSPGGADAGTCPTPPTTNDTNCGWDETSGPDDVEQVTAFRLHLDMLPDSIREFFPGVSHSRTTALTR